MLNVVNKEYKLNITEDNVFRFTLIEKPAINLTLNDSPVIKFVKATERGSPGLTAYQVAVKNGFVGTELEWLESLKETSNSRYDFSIYTQGSFYPSEEVWSFPCVTPFKILANLEGSVVKCKTRAITSFTLLLLKNDVQFGRMVFSSDSDFAYFDSVETIFNTDDILTILADAVVDPNLTNVAMAIAAYRHIYGA